MDMMIAAPQEEIERLIAEGVRHQGNGQLDSAVAAYSRLLELEPNHAAALYSLAAIALNQGRLPEGVQYARRCLRGAPESALAWYIHGVALKASRRLDEALRNFDRALSLQPDHIDSLVEKANILLAAQDFDRCREQLDRILTISPGHAFAGRLRGELAGPVAVETSAVSGSTLRALELQNAGKVAEATAAYLQALEEPGNHFVALYSLAAMSVNAGRIEEARQYAQRCLAADRQSAFAWYINGCALKAARQFEEAHRHFDRAIELNPEYKDALIEKGICHGETKEYVQALVQFNRVIELDTAHKLALVNLATCLTILKRDQEASLYFGRLLEIDPDHDYAIGAMTHARLHNCNWTDFETNRARIFEGVKAGKRSCKPLAFLALSDSPEDQLACARTFTAQAYPPQADSLWNGEKYAHPKLRIGYVSPDLREHPVGHLMAGVFEHHDKSQFEVHSFSLGNNDNSSLRSRFIAASDSFTDVRGKSSREIAQLIRAAEIDVLIDLAGPTADAQPDIFAFRPAPIQAGYLGYPGTSGAPYYDYIIADRTVIPEADQRFYTEKVVYLPHCYLPTDGKLTIAERTPTRAEMNLPEDGFVFCSFNHDYKINPDVFGVWMNILRRVEGSVLWLMKLNEAAEANLRAEAERRGVSGSRLIFATRVPSVQDHLARYRLAGLFLDTTPYNAHTTASDAIRAGLPVLTVIGKSFQSRVATSIVRTVGLPQLAKDSFVEYEAFAVEIARSPELLAALKQELQSKLPSTPLYNTALQAKGLEDVFRQMALR